MTFKPGNLILWVDDLMFFFIKNDICLRLGGHIFLNQFVILTKPQTKDIRVGMNYHPEEHIIL